MKRIAFAILLIVGLASSIGAQTKKFNLRDTASWVTDEAGTVAVTRVAETNYYAPFYEAEKGYGWVGNQVFTRDRVPPGRQTPTPDPRFGGMHYVDDRLSPATFRIDARPGQYNLAVGFGDVQYGSEFDLDILNGDALITTLVGATVEGGQIMDVNGVLRLWSDWPNPEPSRPIVLSGPLNIRIRKGSIAYISLVAVTVAPPPPPPPVEPVIETLISDSSLSVYVDASDASGISSIALFVDDALEPVDVRRARVGFALPERVRMEWTQREPIPAGKYLLKTITCDPSGNCTEKSIYAVKQ